MQSIRQLVLLSLLLLGTSSWTAARGDQGAPAAPVTPAPSTSAAAAPSSPASASCCGAPAPRMVERTIYVPTMAWEKRLMPCVEYTTEPRMQTYTVMHAIPEKKTVTRQYVVMVPETRTKTESYVVCKPVPSSDSCGSCCGGCKYEQETKQREVQYTVCVPQTKQCTYDVTVCKYVPEQRSVNVDACVSHIVQKPVDVCVCHMVMKKVMVPVPTCCCMPCGGCGGWGCGDWGCGW